MEPQTGFEPAFAIQLPFSPFVAEGVTAALKLVDGEGFEPPNIFKAPQMLLLYTFTSYSLDRPLLPFATSSVFTTFSIMWHPP